MRTGAVPLVLAALMAVTSLGAAATGAAPVIPDDEEYAVFAAVLSPPKPEVPDGVKNEALFLAEYRDRVRLDGIPGDAYTVAELTAPGSPPRPRPGPDGPLVADYNAKNGAQYRIEAEKLSRALPNGRVRILPEAERPRLFGGERGKAQGGHAALGREVVSLSRVGFNENRSRAVVHVGCQADLEMGVAYLVFLEKSAKTGRWLLSGTVRTRIH